MPKLSGDLTQKLLFYSLGAGAAAIASSSARADIIYTDLSQYPATGDTLYFNLENQLAGTAPTGGTDDFELSLKTGPPSKAKVIPPITGAALDDSSANALQLTLGTLIDGSGTVGTFTDGNDSYLYEKTSTGTITGNWVPGNRNFLGLSIDVTDPTTMVTTTDYGWADISLNDLNGDGTAFTIYGFAYDNDGSPIFAGEVPEPGTAALLVAGAAGVALLRRRRQDPVVLTEA